MSWLLELGAFYPHSKGFHPRDCCNSLLYSLGTFLCMNGWIGRHCVTIRDFFKYPGRKDIGFLCLDKVPCTNVWLEILGNINPHLTSNFLMCQSPYDLGTTLRLELFSVLKGSGRTCCATASSSVPRLQRYRRNYQ
jgi:hypothetical protein